VQELRWCSNEADDLTAMEVIQATCAQG
jgi:hypothetical protein